MKRLLLAGLLTIFLWCELQGCKSDTGPTVGSESHFLRACAEGYGTDCECICSVCSRSCKKDLDCKTLSPKAQCINVSDRPSSSSCAPETTQAFCDVPCQTKSDCVSLGTDFACNEGFCREDPLTKMTTDGRIDVDELCTFYVNDVCDAKIQCYGWQYPNKEACLTAQECDGWAEFQNLLATDRITFDPVATFECHEKLVADACTLGILLDVPNLAGALHACGASVGRVAEGQPCTGYDCVEETSCWLANGCPGTCKRNKNLPYGSDCITTICLNGDPNCGPCATGLICHDSVCRPDWKLGDDCAGISDCGTKLWCDAATGQCEAQATIGATCSNTQQGAPPCTSDAWCDGIKFETGLCRPLSAQGQECRNEADCQKDLTCLPSAAGSAFGICSEPQTNGAACNSNSDCRSDLCSGDSTCIAQPGPGQTCVNTCAEGSICESSVCLPERDAGQSCDSTSYCVNSRCISGVCTIRSHWGAPCTEKDDCLSNFCSNGLCSDPVSCE